MQDVQGMFDSSMTAAAIAEKVADLQKAAGITTQLVNPYGKGTSFITLTGWVALAALAALFIVVAGEEHPPNIAMPYTMRTPVLQYSIPGL